MNFLAKVVARGTRGTAARAFLRAAVLGGLGCSLNGCGAGSGDYADEGTLESTSEALIVQSITDDAALLGCVGRQRVSLKSLTCQYYVTGEQTGAGAMVCNRTTAGNWETFLVKQITYTNGTKRIALQSNRGAGPYVSATNGGGSSIYANRNAIGDWESFAVTQFVGPLDFSVALQTSNGSYVTKENDCGPSSVLNANRPGIGEWEKFKVQCR